MDTSGLLAAIDKRSRFYSAARESLSELRRERALLVISPFILAEVDYLLSNRWNRPDIARRVLREVVEGRYILEPFGRSDMARAAEVIEAYDDQNIGIADASNVVLAERRETPDILTLDERHFRVLRGPGGAPFRLLPADR